MNDENIRQFFQTLYTCNTGNQFQFEHRVLHACNDERPIKVLQIVSPALHEKDAQQIAAHLKKFLPSSADVNTVSSRKEPGKFRAIIVNPECVLRVYISKMINSLNKNHSPPQVSKEFYIDPFWSSPNGKVIGYRTNVSSNYRSDTMDLNLKFKILQYIEAYNTLLEALYPGLKIKIEYHKFGDAYFIDTFTYENYVSLENPILRNKKVQYEEVNHKLKEDLKKDIENIDIWSPSSLKL